MNIHCLLSAAAATAMLPLLLITGGVSADADDYDYLRTINATIERTPAVKPQRPLLIAIVDDAVNIDHPSIKPFIADQGYDVADDDADVRAPVERMDDYAHGTFLAAAMVKVLQSTLGSAANEYVNIVPIKSLSDFSTNLQLDAAFAGIDYAQSINADIVVSAWAIHQIAKSENSSLDALQQSDTLLISSAGNERIEKKLYPSAHPASLSVAGLNQDAMPWLGSNRGDVVDIAAPAENISGTDYLGTSTIVESGTSFSTALVAAAAALVKVYNPDFSGHQVRACLLNESAAIDTDEPALNGKFGAGLLDVAAAVNCSSINTQPGDSADGRPSLITRTRGYLIAEDSIENQQWRLEQTRQFSGIELQWAVAQTNQPQGPMTVTLVNDKNRSEQLTLAAGEIRRVGYVPAVIKLSENPSQAQAIKNSATAPENTLLSYRLLSEAEHTRWCSGTTIISEDTTLNDGSHSDNYALNSNCKWLFVAPQGKLFEFTVTELDTEANVDKLYFFDGEGTHETLLGVLSGTERPPVFRSWNNKTLLWFVSDGKHQAQGWTIDARLVDVAE